MGMGMRMMMTTLMRMKHLPPQEVMREAVVNTVKRIPMKTLVTTQTPVKRTIAKSLTVMKVLAKTGLISRLRLLRMIDIEVMTMNVVIGEKVEAAVVVAETETDTTNLRRRVKTNIAHLTRRKASMETRTGIGMVEETGRERGVDLLTRVQRKNLATIKV